MSTLELLPTLSKIYVAGHTGLVGSSLYSALENLGYKSILTEKSSTLDLTKQEQVEAYFKQNTPEYVFLCAAKVGGILANSTQPAEFIYNNLQIVANVIHESYKAAVKRLIFLGSSCIYPKNCPQPILEEYLLSGPLEATNQAYALAKIAGIELARAYNAQYGTNFLSVMPCNLYGPNDNFDLQTSHVLPALIRKICEAVDRNESEVTIWGSGKPRREFLFSDDLADALIFLMHLPEEEFTKIGLINIGTGIDISISDLACLIAEKAGFRGSFNFDKTKPDGTFQKLLDVSKMETLGWRPKVTLEEGIGRMVHAYRLSSGR